MKRPEELTDGSRLSLLESAPLSSAETSVVCGVQEVVTPAQVSRRKIWRPLGVLVMRLVAAELKATKRPSVLMEGVLLSALPGVPSAAADSRAVCGWQSEAAPVQVSRRKICAWPFCVAV